MDETTQVYCEICLEPSDPMSMWYQSHGCCSYRCSVARQVEDQVA